MVAFVFVSHASNRGGLKGKELSGLFHALAEGSPCRRSSGNHSVTSLEGSEERCLTRGWACLNRGNHPYGHCRFQFGCGAVGFFLFDMDYTLYLPSWIVRLSCYKTLPRATRYVHFLCGYKKLCLGKVDVTMIQMLHSGKWNDLFMVLFWKVLWRLFKRPVLVPLMSNNCGLLLDGSLVTQ